MEGGKPSHREQLGPLLLCHRSDQRPSFPTESCSAACTKAWHCSSLIFRLYFRLGFLVFLRVLLVCSIFCRGFLLLLLFLFCLGFCFGLFLFGVLFCFVFLTENLSPSLYNREISAPPMTNSFPKSDNKSIIYGINSLT